MPVAWFGLAVFAAAALQATSGFGFALIAMPLASLAVGLELASPVVAAAALLLYSANTLRLRRHVLWGVWLRLGLMGALGVPLGFWLRASAPETLVRWALGALLVLYALYAWRAARPAPRPGHPGWLYPAGLAAGALGAAYNTPGPPAVVFGDAQAWPRDAFRATLQAFFLLNGLLVVGGHAWLGNYGREVVELVFISLPALALGNLAGQWLDRRLDPRRFRRLVAALILATGVVLWL